MYSSVIQTEQLSENIKVIKTLRAQYKESKKADSFTEERRMWRNIESEMKKRGISEVLILMDDFAFNILTEQVIMSYISL